MRKILSCLILLFSILQTFNARSQGCCPQFTLRDDAHVFACKSDERCQGGSNGGPAEGHYACKNSSANYTVFPNLPGFTYTWTVAGGTPTGFSGNPITVTWGNGSTGSLQVIVANGAGTCVDTLTENFCLLTPPTAAFNFSPNTNICSSTILQFNNTSSGANTYYWDFGDGNSSTATNPTHQYATPGTYNVLLTISNVFNGEKCGCSDTMMVVITVDPGTSPEIISSCSKMLCPNDTASYCVNSTCPPFNWTVNGGTIVGPSNQQCVLIQWNNPPANYPTSVTVSTGTCAGQCSSVGTLNVPVLYNNIPISGNTVVCQNSSQTYSLPVLPGTFYSWSVTSGGAILGVDSNSVEFNVQWVGTPGSADTITCIYNNPYTGCGDTSILIVNIRPKFLINGSSPLCVGNTGSYFVTDGGAADFSITPNTGFTPPGPFLNTPLITPTWNVAGNYVVFATPVIAANYCTASSSFNVVINDTPAIGIISGQQVICPGGSYVYSVGTNMPGVGQFYWSVTPGDTILSEMGAHKDSVVVKWNGTGPHTVSVYQMVKGCPSSVATLTVTLVPPPVILTGTANACVDQNFTYAANNTLPSGSYIWSVLPVNSGTITSGQGTNSVQIQWHGSIFNPITFDTVVVTTCGGTDTFFVTVSEPPPTSIAPSGFLCSGINLTSTLSGVSYQWYLNDNPLPSTNTQSININQAGTYMVYVYQSPGACPSRATITIPPDQKPYLVLPCGTGIFDYLPPDTTSIKYCSGSAISSAINVATPGGPCNFQWYMNTYSNPVGANSSSYTATAIGLYWVVTTNIASGCKDTLGYVKIDTICCDNSYAMNFVETGCDTMHFKASITPVPNPQFPYHWCFGDGASAVTVSDSVDHKYKYAGQYTVCVYTYVITGTGDTCAENYCRTIDVPMEADFDTLITCGAVKLTDMSTAMPAYSPYNYFWSSTGPATFSPSNTVANPTITYTAGGTYTVTLTISKNGCSSTISKPVTIYLVNAAINGPTTVCAGTDAPFSATPTGPLYQYAWNFGDNATSFIANTNHSYPTPGTTNYTITLTVTDSHGCTDVATHPITVIAPPPVNITPDTFICPGSTAMLTVTAGFQTYQWYHNGNPISGANSNTYATGAIGQYWVVVTSNNGGCNITSPICQVFYRPLPIANIQGQSIACWDGTNPASIFLYNDPVLSNYAYQWYLGGVPIPAETNYYLNTTQNALGTYSYSLTVTDTSINGGCSVTDTFCVIVGLSPQVIVTPPSGGPFCSGSVYTFTAMGLPPNPNYVYYWNNGVYGQSMSTGQSGNYFVTVTNPVNGCIGTSTAVGIKRSPTAILFPVGCDTLCDTSNIVPPLPLTSNLTYGIYTIDWYDNGNYIYSGPFLPVSVLVPLLGNHNISMVVTFNGCSDSSDVYSIFVIDCLSTIPVKISSFVVNKQNTDAMVSWQMTETIGIDRYEILRSTDGVYFTSVNKISNITGRNNYSYADKYLIAGMYYYRVRVIEKTGASYLTAIRAIRIIDNTAVRLYPNPVKNGLFTIATNDTRHKTIKVFDSRGILKYSYSTVASIYKIDATIWAKGMYMVSVISDDGQVQTKQLVLIK
ncbi:PKD domain-containing protein [Ferruginibacter sp. SUN002]|uniref:PKD domain-containing protein n=1 Tax=Ferruginibacter sp. SUN002 TaxID=2937789 RepID=UPI003D36A8A3